MAKITAEFSNGHRDTYKGTRPVKAAWMITCKETGKVLNSGHSLDRIRARKTAEANVADCVHLADRWAIHAPRSAMYATPAWASHTRKVLAGFGVEVTGGAHALLRAAKAWNADLNAAKRARVTIEIIDL